jgi:hypothetical protein
MEKKQPVLNLLEHAKEAERLATMFSYAGISTPAITRALATSKRNGVMEERDRVAALVRRKAALFDISEDIRGAFEILAKEIEEGT